MISTVIAAAFVLISLILVQVALPWLHCLWLEHVASRKQERLRELSVEVNRLLQEQEHWQRLYSELDSLDEAGLRFWFETLRSDT